MIHDPEWLDQQWAWSLVVNDLREHELTKGGYVAGALPKAFTAGKLMWLRSEACRNVCPGLECAKWRAPDPQPATARQSALQATLRTGEYVCPGCTSPVVPIETLMDALFDPAADPAAPSEVWQDLISEHSAMTASAFLDVLASAWGQKWLALWQLVSLVKQTDELIAAKASLKRLLGQAKERRAFVRFGRSDLTREQLVAEFQSQLDRLNHPIPADTADAADATDAAHASAQVPVSTPTSAVDIIQWAREHMVAVMAEHG